MHSQSSRLIQDYEHAVFRLILYTIGESPLSLGLSTLISILKGGKSAFLLEHNLHHLDTYGILPTFTREYLQAVVGVLIDCTLIHVERVSGYENLPTLKLTEDGRHFLDQTICSETPFAEKLADRAVIELSQRDQALFVALRLVRRTCSNERAMPAYTVCNDSVLREMAMARPATPQALLALHGVGEKFVANYGDVFLKCIEVSGRCEQWARPPGHFVCQTSVPHECVGKQGPLLLLLSIGGIIWPLHGGGWPWDSRDTVTPARTRSTRTICTIRLCRRATFCGKLDAVIPWQEYGTQLLKCYKGAGEYGRPPWEPVLMLKVLLLAQLYDLSRRDTEAYLNENIPAKWFIGLAIDKPAPDYSTIADFQSRLVKNRKAEVFKKLLDDLIILAKSKGVVFGSIQIVDSVHVIADVNTQKDDHRDEEGKPRRDPAAQWGAKHKHKVRDEDGNEKKSHRVLLRLQAAHQHERCIRFDHQPNAHLRRSLMTVTSCHV